LQPIFQGSCGLTSLIAMLHAAFKSAACAFVLSRNAPIANGDWSLMLVGLAIKLLNHSIRQHSNFLNADVQNLAFI